VWGRLWQEAIRNKRPKDADELWLAVQTTFNEYSDDYIDTLVLSFRARDVRRA
jgi:hypothetical protein